MATTLALIGIVLALLIALEVLNALYEAVLQGLASDLEMKKDPPAWLVVPRLVRALLGGIALLGTHVSLWVHELSHALAQLVFGGRPRVVLLKNGGYAQSSPWLDWAPTKLIYALGNGAGQGIMSLAPILVGAGLLLIALVALTPLTFGDLGTLGGDLAADLDRSHARALAATTWHALVAAPWWMWPVAVVICLLLAPGMTPSSVDYVHGYGHILAYAIAALACSGLDRAPRALWLVAPVAGTLGLVAYAKAPRVLKLPLGALGLSISLLALVLAIVRWRTGMAPLDQIHTALAIVAYGFAIAAVVFAVFTTLILVLSLISLHPRTLWRSLCAMPRSLAALVRRIHTCDDCELHYHGKCDGCGRTPDAPAAKPVSG
jgi:hypothetical protein